MVKRLVHLADTAITIVDIADAKLHDITYGTADKNQIQVLQDLGRQSKELLSTVIDYGHKEGVPRLAGKAAYAATSLAWDIAITGKSIQLMNKFAKIAQSKEMGQFLQKAANAINKVAPELEVATAEGIAVKIPVSSEVCALQEAAESTRYGKGNTKLPTNNFESEVKWAADYYKHRPPKNVAWKDIIKSTTNRNAMYKPGINIKELELNAWKQGQKVTNGKNWKVFKSNEIIGANSGKETFYLRVECSANTIHGHPILESQYLELIK